VLQRRLGQLWTSMGPENRAVHHVPRGAFKGRNIVQSFDEPVNKIKKLVGFSVSVPCLELHVAKMIKSGNFFVLLRRIQIPKIFCVFSLHGQGSDFLCLYVKMLFLETVFTFWNIFYCRLDYRVGPDPLYCFICFLLKYSDQHYSIFLDLPSLLLLLQRRKFKIFFISSGHYGCRLVTQRL
jgi:hypothetical protein